MTLMNKTKKLTIIAMLAAVASVLMFLQFSVPMMPSFIKMDFSELPAAVAACLMGPGAGAAVCFFKNLLHALFFSTTGGVGELSDFLLGCLFVIPIGIICKKIEGVKGAAIGAAAGAVTMALVSVFTNYFIVYPVYTAFMPMEAILNMYQAINKNADTLLKALIMFNMPFTFLKGVCSSLILLILGKKNILQNIKKL